MNIVVINNNTNNTTNNLKFIQPMLCPYNVKHRG